MPFFIIPMNVELKTLGCPTLRPMNEFFIDFETDTDADDFYTADVVTHTITPGQFVTSTTLKPKSSYAKFRNASAAVRRAIDMLKPVEEVQ